jgi:hypothetical protein
VAFARDSLSQVYPRLCSVKRPETAWSHSHSLAGLTGLRSERLQPLLNDVRRGQLLKRSRSPIQRLHPFNPSIVQPSICDHEYYSRGNRYSLP